MTRPRRLAIAALGAAASLQAPVASAQLRVLDDFEDISAWQARASDSVDARLRHVPGPRGRALCLDYDFNGVSGYAVAKRRLPMQHAGNFRYRLQLRGEGPTNNLEFKWTDAGGDNVWWVNRPGQALPAQWTPWMLRKRHVQFAWGPSADKAFARTEWFELTISAGQGGGRGSACLDELAIEALPAEDAPVPRPRASAARGDASLAVDGRMDSAWVAAGAGQELRIELGRMREFGGIELHWAPGRHARDYRLELSDDGDAWRPVRSVRDGDGGLDRIALPEAEARWLRLVLERDAGDGFALREITLQSIDYAATPNDFIARVAADARRGLWPRGFSGEQPYWTIIGIDDGREQALIGEDGAIELARGGPSVEPFVLLDGALVAWPDVAPRQSLQDGDLPIPSVLWTHPRFTLETTAFAQGVPGATQLLARYRVRNTSPGPLALTLALAVRPLQVNPPSQFLNTRGGHSPLVSLRFGQDTVAIDGRERIRWSAAPDAAFASHFDAGDVAALLASGGWPAARSAEDPALRMASGAALYRLRLEPGESREVGWIAPLDGALPATVPDLQAAQQAVAEHWRQALDAVSFRVPEQGGALVATLRTALAHMLVSRVGPRLQPGTRSYARAWIRDGAMINEGLLRMGRGDVAGEFLDWFAPHQFPSGKVPCCVDDRGSDPVPENDSHGQLVYAIAEQFRHTRDAAWLASMWPHVAGAVRYMDTLRASERTPANRARNPAFYGLMPASISHEGYSAKPMHSYWDDFWALRGYKDAVHIAHWLGREADARCIAASRDEFAADLHASIAVAVAQHGIDYIPGAAELGDFDATSTTIALAPGGEGARLDPRLLHGTFERYWQRFVARRDGTLPWKDYTPYEWRTVGTFVRLGWRERAWEAIDFFFADRQPAGWNQWAEVVSSTPRKPFFLGDLPHAWVASDFLRAGLDLFAWEREEDGSIVIAGGIPAAWFEGEGVAIAGLRTASGPLGWSLSRNGDIATLAIDEGLRMPAGGVVLDWPWPGTRPVAGDVRDAGGQWRAGELRMRAAGRWRLGIEPGQ